MKNVLEIGYIDIQTYLYRYAYKYAGLTKGIMNRTTNLFVFLMVISFILPSTAFRYAQAAHTAAYMIGFNAGKGDGLSGVRDIGDTCSTDYETSIKTITDSNNCTTGYDAGWNSTCHIGLTKFPNPDYGCPGFTQSQLQKMHDEKYHPHICPERVR
jgi:hypothetical protein